MYQVTYKLFFELFKESKMERDTFWCETTYFAFNISTDKDGKIFLDYDDEKHYDNFVTLDGTFKNKFHFSFQEVNGNKTLFIEDKPFFTIRSTNPLSVIDKVRVKGKEDSILIVEALDGLPLEIREIYQMTRMEFEAGMLAYTNKDFSTSRSLFQSVIEKNPYDTVAKIYLDRTKQHLSAGIPEDWEAVEVMNEK